MTPDQEASVVREIGQFNLRPKDMDLLIRRLKKSEYGHSVAELISEGHLTGIANFKDVADMMRGKGMMPAAHMALRHADLLLDRGVDPDSIAFEMKDKDAGIDLDVATLDSDGSADYGYQLKDVQSVSGVESALRKIRTRQLTPGAANERVAILDVHDSVNSLDKKHLEILKYNHENYGIAFRLRFNDGSVTIPPDHPIYP
ncbi:hypothetical protein FZ103_09470 [Streptomonospora sp. PA3]|nr:hypothetical protein [Streptomonospora sp. PA3]